MNELKVHLQQAIAALHQQGWSNRKIARELSLDRGTVRKYLLAAPKPCEGGAAAFSKPAISLTGSSVAGRQSLCENWRAQIQAATQAGLSAQRICQDLVVEHQFEGSYHSVQRFVQRLKGAEPLPLRRLECEAGAEAQVDFGQGAWVVENGRRKRPHLFRVVLSHSRKGYSEAVWRQTTENFIRCLENAFRSFGGVTQTTVIDYVPRHIINLLFPAEICAQPPKFLGDWARRLWFRSHNF